MYIEKIRRKSCLNHWISREIGGETAKVLARDATVIVSDIQDEKGENGASKIGWHALYLHLDVRNEEKWGK